MGAQNVEVPNYGHFSDFFPNFAYRKLVELSSSALNCHLIIIMYSASAKI